MKSALVAAALLGSAAAFAPSPPSPAASTRLASSAALSVPLPEPAGVDLLGLGEGFAQVMEDAAEAFEPATVFAMKCVSSIGSMKKRSKTCQIVRRRGRIYLIDKKNPRNKVRQGGAKMQKRKKKN